ncbi:MAG TPA: RlmE family RNA methyltransferase [Candidatus Binataceae bacterium]|nr:RlmE family RNA methyltransferase [Candidatus Binataceae bacterium]
MARYEPHDKFYRRAREQGLPSRAAFKLEELLRRFRLVHDGARVLDLGSAPGGWLAILSTAVGNAGRVVGVDLASCARVAANVVTLVGDIRDATVGNAARDALGGPAHVVTSDLSPKLTGIRERDQAQSSVLIETAVAVAVATLKPGGAMVAKLFMGSEFESVRALFAQEFGALEVVRTRAGRPGSAELYVVARHFKRAG